jgi:hypothetical protein
MLAFVPVRGILWERAKNGRDPGDADRRGAKSRWPHCIHLPTDEKGHEITANIEVSKLGQTNCGVVPKEGDRLLCRLRKNGKTSWDVMSGVTVTAKEWEEYTRESEKAVGTVEEWEEWNRRENK